MASTAPPPQPPHGCRVCGDEINLFASMQAKFKGLFKDDAGMSSGGGRSGSGDSHTKNDTAGSKQSSHHQQSSQPPPPPSNPTTPVTTATTIAATASTSTDNQSSSLLPCPPDGTQLGRSTWTFLHSVGAYYPDQPTTFQQDNMKSLIKSISHSYPCDYCAHHMRSYMETHPPEVENRYALSHWFCRVHNEVNERQHKPLFDCSKVLQRWGGEDWDDKYGDKGCDPRPFSDVQSFQ